MNKLFECKVRVYFDNTYSIFANDEDEAIDWLQKEINLDVPSGCVADFDVLEMSEIDRNSERDRDD